MFHQTCEQRSSGCSTIAQKNSAYEKYRDIAGDKYFVSDDETMTEADKDKETKKDRLEIASFYQDKHSVSGRKESERKASVEREKHRQHCNDDDDDDNDNHDDGRAHTDNRSHTQASPHALPHRGGSPCRRKPLLWRSVKAKYALYECEKAYMKRQRQGNNAKWPRLRVDSCVYPDEDDTSYVSVKMANDIISNHHPSMYILDKLVKALRRSVDAVDWSPDAAQETYKNRHIIEPSAVETSSDMCDVDVRISAAAERKNEKRYVRQY